MFVSKLFLDIFLVQNEDIIRRYFSENWKCTS